MDWQTPEDAMRAMFITESSRRQLSAAPPASGAWRLGDDPGNRQFAQIGAMDCERGGSLPATTIAFETWGTLNAAGDNAVLVLHALTGDSHVIGPAGNGHPTAGWWSGLVGEGLVLDPDTWFIVAPNMLGGCQGSTGPASVAPDGVEWGARFPYITIRDQVAAQHSLMEHLGIRGWAAVIGGSMGGMQVLEWAVSYPDQVAKFAILAAPPISSADSIALNFVQTEAIRMDPGFNGGAYYGAADGEGPHHGLALARRMALINYRSPDELDDRFARSWQSGLNPMGGGGRFAVESYLDFHGNKFTRRFDANSYITLVDAMNSHDIGRGRDSVAAALGRATGLGLIVGIDSDRLFSVPGQHEIARHIPNSLSGQEAIVISSPYGHDAFLIEDEIVGAELSRLLQA